MSGPQKALVAVLALAVVLFVAVVACQGRSGEGNAADGQGGLPGLLGGMFGDAAAADPEDLSSGCLQPDGRLLVFAGSCTLRVAPGNDRLRTVRLRTDHPISVENRVPERDQTTSSNIDPGEEFTVAVDRQGGDIGLGCLLPLGQFCAVTLVREEG